MPATSGCPHWPERGVVVALFAFALTARLWVAWTLPPWQGPDEPRHFEFAALLVEKRAELVSERRFISLDDVSPRLQTDVIESMGRNHYWVYTNRPPPPTLPTTFYDVWGPSSTELGRTYSPYP